MATIIVSFRSQEEAQQAIKRLSQANMGEVRARVLDSSDQTVGSGDEANRPMVTPDETLEVRPEYNPGLPEARVEDLSQDASGVIPSTGNTERGVQVMIEVDEENEAAVRRLLSQTGGESGEQVGE